MGCGEFDSDDGDDDEEAAVLGVVFFGVSFFVATGLFLDRLRRCQRGRVSCRLRRMKHSVAHDLSFDLAKKAATRALESYQERFAEYDPKLRWTSDRDAEVSFAVKGMSLKGNFAVQDKCIDIEMDVPLLMRPFRQKALEVVEREIGKWIDKARKGEL